MLAEDMPATFFIDFSNASAAPESGSPYILRWTVLVEDVDCDRPSAEDTIRASKPLSSTISAIRPAVSFFGSCTIIARSASKLMLNCSTPSSSLKPPSTADVHAPQVMPSIATVVVSVSCFAMLFLRGFRCCGYGPAVCESTNFASKPTSSIMSTILW